MEKANNREVAIALSGVKKMYKLGQIGGGTLQGDLQSWWARVRGKEDPNTKIGTDRRLVGNTFMALNGIDLTVYQGEALGIIGGNGAGKSTLLKLLSRVTAPTDGQIDIYGRIASMLEVGTGFHGEMTGRENVYMNGAILGMTRAEIDRKMEDIIEFSEVREFIDTPVKRYSSGMYVKLAFSVAAHLDSEIMIMDEVLAVGDMVFQKKCLDKMRVAAKQEGRTVLYVSHNMNTIRQLCDRCIVLDKGKIIFQGDVEEAIRTYLGTDIEYQSTIEILPSMRDISLAAPEVSIDKVSVDCESGIVMTGEKLDFSFDMTNHLSSCETVYMRLVAKAMDGTPITMSVTEQGIVFDPNEKKTVRFRFETSSLSPGHFNVMFVLYRIGELGMDSNVDVLRDIFTFKVEAEAGYNHNIPWNSQWWGHINSGFLKELEN